MVIKILKCYPFRRLNPPVELVETFGGYVGRLGDDPKKPHKGSDYVWKNQIGVFAPFEVFSAHDGITFQGESNSWGNFVKIYKDVGKHIIATVYAHLKDIPKDIPILPQEKEKRRKAKRLVLQAGDFLGIAWTSGWANGCPQLHFELHLKEIGREGKEGPWQKVDPYGIKKKIDSGEYPQPGESLKGLKHFWATSTPPFADEL